MPTADGTGPVLPAADAGRAAQLAVRLAAVRERIRAAAELYGRDVPELIVVTKFHPAADVALLAGLGVGDFGENRDQEAAAKAAAVGDPALRWHFIGQLQSNKARSVASYAHSVHSVDRDALARALSRAVSARQEASGGPPLRCYVQVNLDPAAAVGGGHGGAGRGGAVPAEVEPLAGLIASLPGLELAGVMAVAPLGEDPDPAFDRLAALSAAMVRSFPQARAISAGMSQDLEQAIRAGATHLRVGSDVLGSRPAIG